MLGLPGGLEWLVIIFVILLLMGNRIPRVMRSMGKAVSELKRGFSEDEDSEHSRGELDDGGSRKGTSSQSRERREK